jgi:hypothetical protein
MDFSVSDAIRQNTLGLSEGFPAGVPRSYNWYKGWNPDGMKMPPADFAAVTGWGAVYRRVGAPADSNSNTTVEVANAKTYVHIHATGKWVLVQDQATYPIKGGHFVTDFAGNAAIPMKVSAGSNGSAVLDAPPSGYNDHFWPSARGTYAPGTVDVVYVQMDMRVTDPNSNLVASVGADWWRDANAPYVQDHSNNPGAGSSNWEKLSTQWRTLGFYSVTTTQFQADPPPPLLGSTIQTRPTITSFAPDSGTVGDGITNANRLTLAGTAEAGSTVKVFDGGSQIGTATANARGAWSVTTAQLSNGTHNFTAPATDLAGNTSPASSALSVRVDTAAPAAPKITSFSPDSATGDGITNANRLTLAGTAEAGSTVKVFDGGSQIGTATANASGAWSFTTAQLSNATHNFTATATDAAGNTSSASSLLTVKVGAAEASPSSPTPNGENFLVKGSFEATSVRAAERAGFSGSTITIGILWNDSFVLLTLILGAVIRIRRNRVVRAVPPWQRTGGRASARSPAGLR